MIDWDRMDVIIDYTAEPRKPDPRIVEIEPPRIELIIFTNPCGCELD